MNAKTMLSDAWHWVRRRDECCIALSQSIKKAFELDHSITGSWQKPVVQRLHGDQSKIDTPAASWVPAAAR
jgi:hypothetical protein